MLFPKIHKVPMRYVMLFSPTLQMRKLRFKEVTFLALNYECVSGMPLCHTGSTLLSGPLHSPVTMEVHPGTSSWVHKGFWSLPDLV